MESRTSDADSAHKVQANFFSNTRLEEDIESAEKRTVGFTVIRIKSMVIPPGGIELKAEVAFAANDVRTNVQICAAFLRRRLEGYQVAGSGSGKQRASARSNINLLGTRETDQENNRHGYEECELSQIQPPCHFVRILGNAPSRINESGGQSS